MHRLFGSTRGRLLVIGLAAIVVATVVVVQALVAPPAPAGPAAGTLTPPRQPLIVSAASVRNGGSQSGVLVNQPVTVSAHALGETGVAALELWDGTQLVAVEEADPGSLSPAFYARWQWAPATAGSHTLLVRAVDVRGGVVQSNAVRVDVGQAQFGSNARPLGGLLALAGPGFPIGVAAPPAAPQYGIAVPALQAILEGCQLKLSVPDPPPAATGIQLVGLAPAAANFAPLMTLAPNAAQGTQSVNLVGGGSFFFAASAFDDSVVAYSPPVEVAAPDGCATGGWSGDVSIVDGKLNAPGNAERAYLYLTQGGGAAVRVPAEQGTFVDAGKDGTLDFGPVLPAVDGSSLTVEAWGWKQGSLIKLGNGAYTPAPGGGTPGGGSTAGGPINFGGGILELSGGMLTTLRVLHKQLSNANSVPPGVTCIGPDENCYYEDPVTADVIERPAIGSTKPLVKKFRWTTVLNNVSQFAWQILPYSPPGTADLAPPFMIDQGVIAVAGGQSEGEFEIDFNKYFHASVAAFEISNSQAPPVVLFSGIGGSPTPTPAPTAGSGGQAGVFTNIGALALGAFSNQFYVRLVPIVFNSAMLPSNPVSLDVVEPAAPILINDPHAGEGTNENAYTVQWSYTPPVGPDSKYARCALVTAVSSDVLPPWSLIYKQHLNTGTPMCYEPPSDDGWSPFDVFDAFVEFVADVWDYVADGYSWIKKQVVSAVLAAVPCTQIASQAVCEGIANTALDAALASFGVPPTLPNFDTAIAALKGDLATVIVDSASVIPGVAQACGLAEAGNVVSSKLKTCEELAGVAIDEIVEQLEQARSEAAGKAAGWYQPGVTFEPDPRGIWHAPSFNLTITRTNDPVLPKTCSLSVSMDSTKKGWKYPELWEGYPKNVTADVKGQPLLAAAMIIPPLAPGESISRQMWLTKPAIWFESWRAELYWHYYKNLLNTDYSEAWALLTAGAELTFRVQSNCAKPSQQGPYVLPKSAYES